MPGLKRTRSSAGAAATQSPTVAAAAAATANVTVAAPAAPAASSSSAAAAVAAPSRAAAAEEISDSDYSDDDSDASSETSEYVIVSMPESLVRHLRADNGSVDVHGLESSMPFFRAPVVLPPPINPVDDTPAAAATTDTNATNEPVECKFVGTYEYSVGTNLLWRVEQPNAEDDGAAPAAASTESLGLSAKKHAKHVKPTKSTPLKKRTAVSGSVPMSATAASLNGGTVVGPPSASALSGPQIRLAGKTWKRLVFARQL